MRVHLLILILLFSPFWLVGQLPNFFQVEISQDLEVIEFDQDSLGVIWIAANEGVFQYNGYEFLVVDAFEGDVQATSLVCLHGRVMIGTSVGTVRIYNVENGAFHSEIQISEDRTISDILEIGPSTLLVAVYGDGVFSFDINSGRTQHWQRDPESRYVHQVARTDNYIAMATDEGLKIYTLEGVPVISSIALPEIICTGVFTTGSNQIWFCDYERTVYQVDEGLSTLTSMNIDSASQIFKLSGNTNELIVSTDDGVFWKDIDLESSTWIKYSDDMNRARALYVDDEYNLWVGDDRSGLWKSCLYIRQIPSFPIGQIQALQVIGNDIWLGTNNGLFSTKVESWQPRSILDGINVTCLTKLEDVVVVGTYNDGIHFYDTNFGLIRSINVDDGLGDNSILALEEYLGGIHIATLYGVYHLDLSEPGFKISQGPPVLSKNYVLCMEADMDGGMWYGNHKAGVTYVKDNTFLSYEVDENGNSLGSVNSIGQTPDGVVWISSENQGLLKIKENQIETWQSPHGDKTAYTSIVPKESGELLLIGDATVDFYSPHEHELISFSEEVGISEMRGFLNDYSKANDKIWFVHNESVWAFENAPPGTRTKVNTVLDKIEVNLNKIDKNNSSFDAVENNFTFAFTGILHRNAERLFYSYKLEGFDEDWRITQDRMVSYPKLPPGMYEFKVKATHDEFAIHEEAASYRFEIQQAYYKTSWFWFLVTVILLVIGILLVQRSKNNQKLKDELAQNKIETQLINLKSQLNPHFMFNSFNTMIGLIEEDPPRGIQFIEYLTDFYRGVLDIGEAELIPLGEEVKLLELYIHLLQERHGDALKIEMKPLRANGKIPPLSLQMLVENAVKHNVVSTANPLRIWLCIEGSHLVVKNTLNARLSSQDSFGIGLNNIRRRYQLLTGKDIIISESPKYFEVRLPIIEEF